MLCRSSRWWSKRTPGYVFWRQSSLTELEHSKRNYLLSERPVPLGEISRRMARVKSRYEDTQDYHERNLLRGEYKYFTGKLCDLRSARFCDMVVVLQCAAFFGFWDASLVERILAEVFLQLENVGAAELVALFACMPQLRRQETELYRRLAVELVPLLPDLTTEERLAICRACTSETPSELIESVLRSLGESLSELSSSECVDVLDTWGAAAAGVRLRLQAIMNRVRERTLSGLEELDCMDVAVLYTTCSSPAHAGVRGVEPGMSDTLERKLINAFTRDMTRTCPRSTAMLFTAVRGRHSLALELAYTMADRVLFFSTDFTPAELLAVFQVYVEGLVSLFVLNAELRASASSASPVLSAYRPPSSAAACSLRAGTATTCATTDGSPQTVAIVSLSNASLAATRQRVLEQELASLSLSTLQRVGSGLSAQLVIMLESASAYVTTTSQMELVELFVEAVEQLVVAHGASVDGVTPKSSPSEATAQLMGLLPHTRQVLHLISNKLVANMKTLSRNELVQVLEHSNSLGPTALQDAVVAAAVQQLITRDVTGLTSDAALALEQRLRALTGLRAEHQRCLTSALIPKVRRFV